MWRVALILIALFSVIVPVRAQVGLPGDVAGNIRAIYQNGLEQGNRPEVFSKVGDSSTVSYNFLGPIGDGTYDLGAHPYLQGTIDFYTATPVGTGNSFNNQSKAAGIGWSAATLTNPAYAGAGCRSGESPLRCEFRVSQPSVALIMIGNNEVTYLSVEDYIANMQRVIDTSVEMGVIPVISTLHDRRGNTEKVDAYNAALRQLAAQNRVPLWDYAAAIAPLPNNGLTEDRTHPNTPPGSWYRATTEFTDENLQYGFTVRNLTALQMLHAVRGALG
ncbi:MAG: SGNH/GDSL hydrolase family protein [Chloroflexota bacterium]